MTASHDFPIRVYYEDTDAGGIVYHASYLRFAERGRTELLREHGFQNSDLSNEFNILFVVRHMEIDYLKPARLDDNLVVSTSIQWVRNSSLLMRQDIKLDETILCSCMVTVVTVNAEGKPTRIPDDLRKMFNTYLSESE